jgi:oligopeptide/dipeptide ABC transporter ATP-binding protein
MTVNESASTAAPAVADRAGQSPIVELRDVVKHYRTRARGVVHALDGVSFTIAPGETLGLVGESGCGKSTTARLMVQLETPTGGSIVVDGVNLGSATASERRALKRTIQMVFQDPYASLDPRVTVGEAIAEVLAVHRIRSGRASRAARGAELLDMVGLPRSVASRLPHELSGGQRQRIGIARALAVEPKILVLDEAVSALDVSVRAEVMNLLAGLRRELDLSYVFISHDLGMVRHISDRIAVMYLGQIVEIGPWHQVSDNPAHPYTAALQSAVPAGAGPDASGSRPIVTIAGDVPDAAKPPAGCRFHPRCPLAEPQCATLQPPLLPFAPPPANAAGADHFLACHVVQRERARATELLARQAGR